jgi:hypothetical protein
VLIVGATGSGKSHLASALANRWDRVLIFDPKSDDESMIPNAAVCTNVNDALKAIPGRVVWRPNAGELARVDELWDLLVAKIWRLGGRHAIVSHESRMLGTADRGYLPYFEIAHLQGRSMFVPIVDCSQRPVELPRDTISEATHTVCFYLSDERDRKTMATTMGEAVKAAMPFDHDYWYCGRDKVTVRCAAI